MSLTVGMMCRTIAIQNWLNGKPDIDPLSVNFVEAAAIWILELPEFDDTIRPA
jgi:FeS assembly protein IscX